METFHRGGIIHKILPFMFMVCIWSYSATVVPVLKTIIPAAGGFSPSSVLTFLCVYVVARTSKLYEDKLCTKWLFLAATASGIFTWIGFHHNCSPFSWIFAGAMFYLVKRMPLPSLLEKMVMFISPSMFAVYLLHTNRFGFDLLSKAEAYLMSAGWNYYVMAFTVAIGIFVVCFVLDMPRRVLLYFLEKKSCQNQSISM